MTRIIKLLGISLIFCHVISGQNLQTASEFLGYETSTKFTYHHRMVDYFVHVAENSSRVKLIKYGKTFENRPLLVAVISSEENINNLEQIRENNLIHTGLLEGEYVGEQKPIVWLSYNVHGNESVGTESAIATLNSLTDTKNEEITKWLEKVIVIIDPCLNPDGRERYVNWYRQVENINPNVDYDSWEHSQPWPGGRSNHYFFDLNRDWAWQTQIESQQRIKVYQEWMPHIHIDFHEMGPNSPYFFAPGAKPYHEVITEWQREFHRLMGKQNAKYFDKNSWLYFSAEQFDLFTPNYGDTWPLFNGAMGFTYEQGGSGAAGLAIKKSDGDTLTLKDRVDHHHISSLSGIEAGYIYSEKLLSEFNKFFDDAVKSPFGTYKSYLIKSTNNKDRVNALLSLLDKQDVRYGFSAVNEKSYTGFDYRNNKEGRVNVNSNDIVISLYQPKSRLAKVLFEPKSYFSDSASYDITAWSLPYVYNLDVFAIKEKIDITDKPVIFEFEDNKLPEGKPYAYLVDWNDFQDVKFLSALLINKIKVRYAENKFKIEGHEYNKGTLIITRKGNEQLKTKFDELVVKISNKFKRKLYTTKTGHVDEGKDFGSSYVKFIKKPKIAIAGGESASSSSLGEIWFYFEQELEYPVTIISSDNISRVELNKYDVLVLPSGSYSGLKMTEKLLSFARQGGKIIAMERAMQVFAGEKSTALGKITIQEREKKEKKEAAEDSKKSAQDEELLKRYEDRRRANLTERVSGSIFKIHLDDSHPLAFGIGREWYVLKRSRTPYPYLPTGGWNVGVIKKDSHIAGFAGAKYLEEIKGTFCFGVENAGGGQIIYITDSPLFRGFWYSGKLLFGNMVFLYY